MLSHDNIRVDFIYLESTFILDGESGERTLRLIYLVYTAWARGFTSSSRTTCRECEPRKVVPRASIRVLGGDF